MSLLCFSCFPDDEPDEVSREKNIISSFLLANLSTVDVSKYVQKKVGGGREEGKGEERKEGGREGREVGTKNCLGNITCLLFFPMSSLPSQLSHEGLILHFWISFART